MSKVLQVVHSPKAGLELEARLFSGADTGAVVWTSRTRGIVCPTSLARHAKFDRAAGLAKGEGWPIATRPTGGGAVPHGPGILNLAMCYEVPPGFTIRSAYALLVAALRNGLSDLVECINVGPVKDSFCNGSWNLKIGDQKIAGTAQRWKPLPCGGARILAHALVLVEGDIEGPATAIADFHRRLGLLRVDPRAHTTIAAHCGTNLDKERVALNLYRSALDRRVSEHPSRVAA